MWLTRDRERKEKKEIFANVSQHDCINWGSRRAIQTAYESVATSLINHKKMASARSTKC
jgi:hypothetical protein